MTSSERWEQLQRDQREAANGNGAVPLEPPPEEPPPGLLADWHAEAVAREVDRLTVIEEAKLEIARRRAGALDRPAFEDLDDFLAEPDPDIAYRIDGLLVIGARVIVVAKAKAGKTTMRDNLTRSLADGDPFLDAFDVHPSAGNVVVIDNEMDKRSMRRSLRRQEVQNGKRVKVLSLRGRVETFNIMDSACRAGWAKDLRALDCGVLLFDCIGPVMVALGMDENHDAGLFLNALNSLMVEAGCEQAEAVVFHHMGHSGERGRGDSRLRGTPDAEWKIVQDGNDDDLDSPRFFRAYGRDEVDVPAAALDLDKTVNRLVYVAGAGRQNAQRRAKSEAAAEAALLTVIEVLRDAESELATRYVLSAVKEVAPSHSRGAVERALELGHTRFDVLTTPGANNATLYSLNPARR